MPRSRPWSASRSLWGSSLPAGPAALSVGGASCRGVPLVQVRRQLRGGSSVRRDRPGRAYPLRLRLRHAVLSVGRVLRECSFCRAYLAGARLWRRRIVGCGRVQSSPDAPCRRAPSAGRSKVRWTHPARAFARCTCPCSLRPRPCPHPGSCSAASAWLTAGPASLANLASPSSTADASN